MVSLLFMAVLERTARAGIDNAYDGIYIFLVRDNPGFTFQIKELAAAAHAISRVLANTGIEIDIYFLTGIGPVTCLQEIVIHDIASVIIMFVC